MGERLTELLSPERVAAIRAEWSPGGNVALRSLATAPVAEDVVALCDTVQSLRAERNELAEVLVEGAMDADELVAGLRAKHEARRSRGDDRE